MDEMQKLLKVNCLHKGDFDSCVGKRWVVAVDGSMSSYLALDEALKLVHPRKDHVFVITGTFNPPAVIVDRGMNAHSSIGRSRSLTMALRCCLQCERRRRCPSVPSPWRLT